jgi:hypothetical protein
VKNRGRRLKGVGSNTEQGIGPICNNGEHWNHILWCEGAMISRAVILYKTFRNIYTGISIGMIMNRNGSK